MGHFHRSNWMQNSWHWWGHHQISGPRRKLFVSLMESGNHCCKNKNVFCWVWFIGGLRKGWFFQSNLLLARDIQKTCKSWDKLMPSNGAGLDHQLSKIYIFHTSRCASHISGLWVQNVGNVAMGPQASKIQAALGLTFALLGWPLSCSLHPGCKNTVFLKQLCSMTPKRPPNSNSELIPFNVFV